MPKISIYTDSTADLPKEWLASNDVTAIKLTYLIDDEEFEESSREDDIQIFYAKLKEGKMSKTSAISIQTFTDLFEKELKAGNDVIYTGLSGKLSATCNNAFLSMEQLNEKYSDCQVYVTDSISTAAPLGELIKHAVDLRNSGKSAQEIVDAIDTQKHQWEAWVGVDDLMHLKRGGRISGAAATVGSILNIKPIIILAPDGSLVLKDKVKGNKKVFKYFLSAIDKYALDPVNDTIYILHTEAKELAGELKEAIQKEFGTKQVNIGYIGTVIGSHLGPGAIITICKIKSREEIK